MVREKNSKFADGIKMKATTTQIHPVLAAHIHKQENREAGIHEVSPEKAKMKNVFKTDNEILIFVMNFFLLETVGKLLVLGLIHVLRYFGLHQPYYLYYGHHDSPFWLFNIMLLTAVAISFYRILKKRKNSDK